MGCHGRVGTERFCFAAVRLVVAASPDSDDLHSYNAVLGAASPRAGNRPIPRYARLGVAGGDYFVIGYGVPLGASFVSLDTAQ